MSSELIGATLGPYEIVEFLGTYGVAEVFRGRHVETGRDVLIRMAGRDMDPDPVWSARFRREAKGIAGLKHANIAPAYDFGEALDGHYMVSDFTNEATLADLLAEMRVGMRSFQQDDISFTIRQLAAALDHAHSHGVVHRDVSPAHILITRSGQAILADFGLPFLLSRGFDERAGGGAFATPEYMAPEVLADFRAASPASDTYSLGAVLYELLTGDLPFNSPDGVDSALKAIAGTTPDPRLRNPDIFPSVADVAITALAESPKDRFKNTMQLAEALELAYRFPDGIPRKAARPEPVIEPPAPKMPPLSIGKRPTADRVVGRHGASLQDERREKARLRAELRAIQSEEKKRNRAELNRIRQQQMGVFFKRWGPTMGALAAFVLVVGLVIFGLQALGVITISVAGPRPGSSAAAVIPPIATEIATPTLIVLPTDQPSSTPILSPTALQPGDATPIPPVVFTPLSVGTSAFRSLDGGAMQFVPAGQFMMGTDDPARQPSVRPRHPVMLSDYWIDRTEVSNVQYNLCVIAGVCESPINRRYFDDPEYANFPVVHVNYGDAVSYCLWVARQTSQVVGLPTEAQWEKAAAWDPTNDTSRTYPWGNDQPDPKLLRYQAGNEDRPASQVGSHPWGASAYGVQDMSGNVWEWVADWWDAEYYQRTGIAVDPTGPVTGTRRISRGGGWRDSALLLMSNVRNPAEPDTSGDSLGFRCAMTASRPPDGAGFMLTALDVVQNLTDMVGASTTDPGNDQAALADWVASLDDLKQRLQTGDQSGAQITISTLQTQLGNLRADGKVTPGLNWRLNGGLNWISSQFAPIVTPAVVPSPTQGAGGEPIVPGTPVGG